MDDLLQDVQVSTDSKTLGFDLSAGKTWIYPENYPIRNYQFKIVENALHHNTLVCLPTGLGKTFIAAVVMYNYWRWYPQGKIIFLAPTRPLVTQQIQACHDIMGIPIEETIELTGSINQKQRELLWASKRVIFATPQVFHNDLEKHVLPSHLIKCVVIDEAHRALGKQSYCEAIRLLIERNQYFRILALSATPGNKIDKVHEVLKNLFISHVELRDDTSPDIIPYINERKIDIILVKLSDELAKFRDKYLMIMNPHFRVLVQYNILKGNVADITKGRIFYLMREYQNKATKSANHGQIMKTLNILMTMYHGYELMVRHGLRAFISFYQNHSDKYWMNSEVELKLLLQEVESYLGPFPDVADFPNIAAPKIPDDIKFGHNKFLKLKELLLSHFKTREKEDTRAIVFVEYRDIVNEVYVLLLQCRPLIRPQMFVGQAGQKRKQQIKALENFRKNNMNVLISTSIGEEGLDVGEVDLIICFDVSQQSPTRLVQRMGRTGRKRDGHIIVLVTDGKEHEALKSTIKRRDSLNNKILHTSGILESLYENNPSMIPTGINPECHKMHIASLPNTDVEKKKTKKSVVNKKSTTNASLNVDDDKLKEKNSKISKKTAGQYSMHKFFTTEKPNLELLDGYEHLSAAKTQNTKCTQNLIKPDEVKLLSSDNDAIEFLTMCAMWKSKKDTQNCNSKQIDMSYIPADPPIDVKSLLNFILPDINCLSNLPDIKEPTSPINNPDIITQSDTQDFIDNRAWCSHRFNDFEITSPVHETFNENVVSTTRFEDLLDESSDSSTSVNTKKEQIQRQAVKESLPIVLEDCDDFFVDDFDIPKLENKTTNFCDILEDSSESVIEREKNSSPIETKENSKTDKDDNEDTFSFTQAMSEIQQYTEKKKSVILNNTLQQPASHTESSKTPSNSNKFSDIIDLSTDSSDESQMNDAEAIIIDNNQTESVKPKPDAKMEFTLNDEDFDWTSDFEISHRKSVPLSEVKCASPENNLKYENNTTSKKRKSVTFQDVNRDISPNVDDFDWNSDFESNFPKSVLTREAKHENSNNFECEDANSSKKPKSVTFQELDHEISPLLDDCDWNSDFEITTDPSINKIQHCSTPKVPNKKYSQRSNTNFVDILEDDSASSVINNTEGSKVINNNNHSRGESLSSIGNWTNNDSNWTAITSRKDESPILPPSLKSRNQMNRKPTASRSSIQPPTVDNSDEDEFSEWINVSKTSTNETPVAKKSLANKLASIKVPSKLKKPSFIERINLDSDSESESEVVNLDTLKKNSNYFSSKETKETGSSTRNAVIEIHDSDSNDWFERDSQKTVFELSAWEKSANESKTSLAHKERKLPCKNISEQELKTKLKGEKKTKRNYNPFIDDEANVSTDVEVSDDEEVSGINEELSDFISHTQNATMDDKMRAHYLKTAKSPARRAGGFVIKPIETKIEEIEIYSQVEPDLDESYVNDSFCVNDVETVADTSGYGYSILEQAEKALKERRKKRKRSPVNGEDEEVCRNIDKRKKRRVYMLNDSGSSEDEMESLRRQIAEESMVLKNC